MILPFFVLLLLLLLWRYKKIEQIRKADSDSFWEKERIANTTLAQDITNLDYITIPIAKFPLNFSEEEDILALENELTELSDKKILNLTNVTNTELKTMYGVPNFETMQQIGENYDRLSVALDKYGQALYSKGLIDSAISVLEFAVGTKTDISNSYCLLADCYKLKGQTSKLANLKTLVENSNLMLKQKIIDHIDEPYKDATMDIPDSEGLVQNK